MNEEYVQEPVEETTENTDAQAVEDFEEGIELTDTASNEEEKKEVKSYTDEELEKIVNERINEILPRKIEKEKKKLSRQYSDRLAEYEETESILRAGMGTKNISESNQRMREFYKEQGVEIPEYSKPRYSDEDEKVLGLSDAKKIIDLGFEDMQEEANRLASIGVDKMSPREKALFNELANELTHQKNKKELAQIGVKDDILNDDEFKKFTNQFNSKTSLKTIYELYEKTKPKPKVSVIGSMKTNIPDKVKDFYTEEEIGRLTDEELDDPKVWEAVRRSMTNGN